MTDSTKPEHTHTSEEYERCEECLAKVRAPQEPRPSEPQRQRWICEICKADYAEYVNGCPNCELRGIRAKVIFSHEPAAPAPVLRSSRWPVDILRKHYLAGIECDHQAHTDRAMCACSKWNCPPQSSVGAAVEMWIQHLQQVGIDEEFVGMATDEQYQSEAVNLAESAPLRSPEPLSADIIKKLSEDILSELYGNCEYSNDRWSCDQCSPTLHKISELTKAALASRSSGEGRIKQLEDTLHEILGYFPEREMIDDLKPDAGYGYRPAICGKNHGLGALPRDSDVIRWLNIVEVRTAGEQEEKPE